MEKTKKIEMVPGVPKGMNWEMKDRLYYLTTKEQPLVFKLPSKHTRRKPLLWFDKELGYQRELRYATNQPSPLVEEQKGASTLGHIVFRNGTLEVPARQQSLQKMLSIYHPLNGVIFREHDAVEKADNELDYMELEIEALNLAKKLEIDELEAILRVEKGNKVSKLSTKELKRDALVFAKNNPEAFIDLAQDDNVHLRNVGIKAVEANIIQLSPDGKQFTWGNGRKLFKVPFEENPYSALAAWFKTDDGVEVLGAVEKKMK